METVELKPIKVDVVFQNGYVDIARRDGAQVVCDIFDLIGFGESFRPRDLVGKIECLEHYAKRTQKEVITLICRQLVLEHADDNPLLVSPRKGRYIVPDGREHEGHTGTAK